MNNTIINNIKETEEIQGKPGRIQPAAISGTTLSRKIDWESIENKWRKVWQDQKIYESDPDPSRKKYFVTVAYPYPNSPQHVGHGRTYTLADVHARYMRMKGFNVLFPMGFHYTGTPILGMSRRIAANDKELLDTFKNLYHVPDDTIASFVQPVNIARYFHNEIKSGMKEMGYSIDWRREFTTIDTAYSKFIAWQFRLLKKKGLIIQGSHPVGWCPSDQNPVSQHDTMGDVEPDFNEYVLVKFKLDDYVVPTATLRPETVFGVTNLWVNMDVKYVKAKIDGEKWIISKSAARKLEYQNHLVSVESEIYGRDIVGRIAIDPIRNTPVPILPASFVEAESGTGVVMSVPAHAPYDYQALLDLRDQSIQKELGLQVSINPLKIIESEGSSDNLTMSPAEHIVRQYKIKDQMDPLLEKATNELYSLEFYKGRMMQNTGRFAGLTVSKAKELVRETLVSSGSATIMYELVNKPVKCRCGTECVVKILNDQWFLNYGDPDWKRLAHLCINKMDIVPEDIREEFNYVIDWLRERACARKSGLGTKLPWDNEWIIESLSDSVIYMVYYIFAKYFSPDSAHNNAGQVNSAGPGGLIDPQMLDDSFFNYVILGQGDASAVAKTCQISDHLLKQIRDEFSYFYPVDSRHSGRDLVPNHLSFFIFNHVAIFEKEKWPKQIVVNGSVLMDGKKMSKSLGNIIPLRAAIKEHSADAIRLAMLVSAELLQDADFSFESVRGIRSKLHDIYGMALQYRTKFETPLETSLEDRWLLSKLQRTIYDITESLDKLRVREALHAILYSMDMDLQWYRKRVRAKGRDSLVSGIIFQYLDARVRMLSPFAPYLSEEIWQMYGNTRSISFASWPVANLELVNEESEESENLIASIISDIHNIIKVTKLTPRKITIYTSASWKYNLYRRILKEIAGGTTNFGDIMKRLVSDKETAAAKSDPGMVKKMIEDILSEPTIARERRLKLSEYDQISALSDAKTLVSFEAGNPDSEVIIYSEDEPHKYDPKSKAKFARPFKPAIYIE